MKSKCGDCNGTGTYTGLTRTETCETCGGSGEIESVSTGRRTVIDPVFDCAILAGIARNNAALQRVNATIESALNRNQVIPGCKISVAASRFTLTTDGDTGIIVEAIVLPETP